MLLRYSLLALTLAACGGSTAPSYGGNNPPPGGGGGGGLSASVTIANTSYVPSSITVNAGTKVTWTNNDAIGHTVTSDAAGAFDGSLSGGMTDPYGNPSAGGSFSHTFASTGSFPYHCNVHPTLMHGTVTVNP